MAKTALITINAEGAEKRFPPAEQTFLRSLAQNADWLIAADGGALLYLKSGLLPHLVVGDLDSLSARVANRLKKAGVDIWRFPPEKDDSDLQLALEAAQVRGAKNILIYGGVSRQFPLRPDHLLINLNLLLWAQSRGLNAKWLLDSKTSLFAAGEETVIEGERGDTVSLIPLSEKVEATTLEGFAYPLKNEDLLRESSRGLSNQLADSRGIIRKGSGRLLAVHIKI